ncbi:MAG: SoxR reducing system RseC family protein [Spirochaetes bacterium]|nr:SoxR reducing system RseC family protein [Spirochaetota bacterium]
MTEKGIVDSIGDDIITILCSENPYCSSCNACEQSEEGKKLKARNPKDLSISTGDFVEIYLSPGKSILAGFMVFIMPIIMFFIFYYSAIYIVGTKIEAIQILFGLSGIAVGFAANFMYGRIRKDSDLPEITRVLNKPDPNEYYAELMAKNRQ